MIKDLIKNVAYPIIKSRPDFLIVGAQKAGTTSLYNYLIQHSNVIENNSFKEIHYFDKFQNYQRGFGWYLGYFPSKKQKENKLTLDATPEYLYFQHIPQLIKKDLGNIKMIAILRNPVDRAYSAWKMYHSFSENPHDHLRNIADKRTFPEAIEEEQKGIKFEYPYDYINRGKYAEQLENYYKHFAKESLLILNFNQLKDDLDNLLNSVCDFLSLERFSSEKLQELKETKYNYGKYNFAKSESDLQVIQQLKDDFIPYNEELYNLLGYRYTW
ncbi:sulfotransferase domain-containing protein [Lyngbya sp. PCC 8106]|uniref:sulfotransferase domain-containing protein n=1 Tax=Lyngbya sp. (strain PCC 8106) TaxID=313612 RepID=UPI0000EA9C2C|nr:sulfotransferase domain-containing protein [Lyngbya sp. PCC 8106]EAW37328.1 putative deacetylase sulfotransferase [Lyngbya sp. PCC 8106]